MCSLGDPLTAGEMTERLSSVPADALIRFTSWDRDGKVVTFTVHRADYPVTSFVDKKDAVWLSFDAFQGELNAIQ